MFSIYDGRDVFYQWDIDRKLIINDKTITQVHFCNKTDDCSLVCDVYMLDGKRVADVPNILLQFDWPIYVYAYDTNYTKHCIKYDVNPRSKPDNYVYTETETLNYNTLLMRMDSIDEGLEARIDEYLTENPVEVDLSAYATTEYVDSAVGNIEIPEVDLTPYALKSDIPEVDLTPYALKNEIPDVSGYALKSEIPSTTGLATEEYVNEAIGAIDIPEVDLSGYALKSEIPDVSGYQTEAQVIALIEEFGGGGGGDLPASEEVEF